eukprot:3914639-Pyramimonas_sp.AAC.2
MQTTTICVGVGVHDVTPRASSSSRRECFIQLFESCCGSLFRGCGGTYRPGAQYYYYLISVVVPLFSVVPILVFEDEVEFRPWGWCCNPLRLSTASSVQLLNTAS